MVTAVLGIDAGTSGCKTVLLSLDGRVLASATRTYPTRRGADGSATQDAADWVDAMVATTRAVLGDAPGYDVAAIGITAPAHNVVLVPRDGGAPPPVLLWSDRRPAAEVERLLDAHPGYFERTLVRLSTGWTLPQLAWMRRERPDWWRGCDRILPGKDYLRFVLTGKAATDPSDAAGTGLYDPAAGEWWHELADAVDAGARLPPILRPSESGGVLASEMAAALGLTPGIPVVVGATDTAAELLSIGARDPGDGLVKVASTGTVVVVTDRVASDPALLIYPHADEGRWYVVAATNTAATAHAWIARQFSGFDVDGEPPLSELVQRVERSAGEAPPGADGALFLPFLDGERTPYWDPELRAAFLGLTGHHGPAHLARAVMEGVAMSLRCGLDAIRACGHELRAPALTGGGLESELWRRIVVAALGLGGAVRIRQHGPAIGVAMIAGRAVGADVPLPALPEAVPAPEATWRRRYEQLFELYRSAVEATRSLSHELAAFAAAGSD